MAAWNPFAKKKDTPEVTPAPPIVTPEEKQPQAQPAAAAPAEPAQTEKKKTRRGKPQDRSKLTRNKVVQIRLTEEEVAELKAAASAAGMSMADFVMAGVHESRRIVVPGAIDLRKELLREGNNLNQALMLAYAARKEGRPADLQSIQAAVAKVEDNLDQMAELLMKWDADLTEETKKK